MSRRSTDDEEDAWDDRFDSDDLDSEDGESDGFGSEEDDEPTIPCPHCGREIHEDSPRCPWCETYLSREDAPPTARPWWLVIGVAACLYVVYRWIAG